MKLRLMKESGETVYENDGDEFEDIGIGISKHVDEHK
jgi:hypothetical protein